MFMLELHVPSSVIVVLRFLALKRYEQRVWQIEKGRYLYISQSAVLSIFVDCVMSLCHVFIFPCGGMDMPEEVIEMLSEQSIY